MIFRFITLTVFNLLLPAALADDFDLGDYSIRKPSLTIQNDDGIFAVSLGYKVGSDATSFNVTLLNNDCKTEYTSNKVMKLKNVVQSVVPDSYSTEIILYTNEFKDSPLVTPSDNYGYSAGDLQFCVMAEAYEGDISVVFYKERIQISYDLTINNFQIDDIAVTVDNFSPMGPNSEVSASVDTIFSTCTTTDHIVDYSDRVQDAIPVTIPFTQEDSKIVGQTVTFKCGGNFYMSIITHPEGSSEKGLHLSTNAIKCQDQADSVPGRKLAGIEEQTGINVGSYPKTPFRNERKLNARLPIAITDFNVACDPGGNFTMEIKADVVSKIDEKLYMARHSVDAHYGPNLEVFNILFANVQTKEYTAQLVDFVSTYGISACRCKTTSYLCETNLPALKQNELLSICMETDNSDVSVSNFNMALKQGGEEVYSVASIGNNGPVSSSLSVIFNSNDKVRVVSRVVSALFESSEETFDVEGNAYLEFNERRTKRRLGTLSGYRSLQALPEGDTVQNWYTGDPVGNTPFSMKIQIDKSTTLDTKAHHSSQVMWLSVIGGIVGCLGLLIVGVVVFKNRTDSGESKDEDPTATDMIKNLSVHSSNTDDSGIGDTLPTNTTDPNTDAPTINVTDAVTDQQSDEEGFTCPTDEQHVEDVLICTTDQPSGEDVLNCDKTETDQPSGEDVLNCDKTETDYSPGIV